MQIVKEIIGFLTTKIKQKIMDLRLEEGALIRKQSKDWAAPRANAHFSCFWEACPWASGNIRDLPQDSTFSQSVSSVVQSFSRVRLFATP